MENYFLLSRRLAPGQRVPVAWPPPAAAPLLICSRVKIATVYLIHSRAPCLQMEAVIYMYLLSEYI